MKKFFLIVGFYLLIGILMVVNARCEEVKYDATKRGAELTALLQKATQELEQKKQEIAMIQGAMIELQYQVKKTTPKKETGKKDK